MFVARQDGMLYYCLASLLFCQYVQHTPAPDGFAALCQARCRCKLLDCSPDPQFHPGRDFPGMLLWLRAESQQGGSRGML